MGGRGLILLDTHVLLWWKAGGHRLSARAAEAINSAPTILISPVSFWEASMLLAKGRIGLDRDIYVWANDIADEPRVEIAGLTPVAAIAAGRLGEQGFAGDPADCLIYATAKERLAKVVTKDRSIRSFAAANRDVKTIW